MEGKEEKKYVGVWELAKHLNTSPWSIYRLLQKELNGVPRVKVGRKYLFELAEVDRWLKENKGNYF